jgi:hypothetical protein
MEIKIPFVISPHEKALGNIFADLNKKYRSEFSRWRFIHTTKPTSGGVSITGRLLFEKLEGSTWVCVSESAEYTVAESGGIYNVIYCQALIKVVYFCLISLGDVPDWKFAVEDQRAIKKLYTPEVSWDDDMKKSGIDIEEMFKRRGSLMEIKMYIKSTCPSYSLDSLISHAKKAYKSTKLSGSQLLRFIYGQTKYRAYSGLRNKREAKRVVGAVEKPVVGAVERSIVRDTGSIVRLRNEFEALGVNKQTYGELLPECRSHYGDFSVFLANASDEMVAGAISLLKGN